VTATSPRALLVVGLLLAGCRTGYLTTEDAKPMDRLIDDRNIESRVRMELGKDPETAAYDAIVVRCDHGVVILEGTVDRPEVKSRAERLARGCRGVVAVENNITATGTG